MATAHNFNAKPPETLKLVTDAVSNWKLWKQIWKNYAIVADIQSESRSPEFIKALFITTMGIEGLQLYNACDPEDTDTIDEIIQKLDEHILGQTNETCERYKFNARGQMCEEAIDAYDAALKNSPEHVQFLRLPEGQSAERPDRLRYPGQWSEEKTSAGAQPRPV